MKNNTLLLICFMCIQQALFSQDTIMEYDVEDYAYNDEDGPNRKKFKHLFVDFGLASDALSDSMVVKFGISYCTSIGYRYKVKLNNTFDFGMDAIYQYSVYNYKKDYSFTTLPIPKYEKYVYHSLSFEAFQRINFPKRGNTIRYFIDAGVFASFDFSVQNKLWYKLSDDNAGIKRVIYKDLDYINRFHYGCQARVGYTRYALFGRYRFSNRFTKASGLDELSRLTIGFQIGLHK